MRLHTKNHRVLGEHPRSKREPSKVAVICAAFNHKPYIQQTLDGFLRQETDFAFDVLIQDDASTDGTSDVIAEHATRFPDKFTAILQEANQFSCGRRAVDALLSLTDAELIAICEGDDFWVDAQKLQIQYAALTENTASDLCCHSVYHINGTAEQLLGPYYRLRYGNAIIPVGEVIEGGGGYLPTPSLMIRRQVLENLLSKPYYDSLPVLDYFWQIYGSSRGGAIYIDRPMAAYRQNIPGSWTTRMNDDLTSFTASERRFLYCLDEARKDFESRSPSFDRFIAAHFTNSLRKGLFMRSQPLVAFCSKTLLQRTTSLSPLHRLRAQCILHVPATRPFIRYCWLIYGWIHSQAATMWRYFKRKLEKSRRTKL